MEYIVPILGDGINPQYYCQYLEIRCQSPAAAEGGGPGVDASPGVLGLGTCVSLTACFGAARFSPTISNSRFSDSTTCAAAASERASVDGARSEDLARWPMRHGRLVERELGREM